MNRKGSVQVRAGNEALTGLIVQCSQSDAKLERLIDSLPNFANELYSVAHGEARKLLRRSASNVLQRIVRAFVAAGSSTSAKEAALANSIFDLHLGVVFKQVTEYLGDNTTASLFVDALLYQATGFESRPATEEEVLHYGTQNARGLQKFQLGRKLMPHIKDTEGWMFGSEYSAIVSGDPKLISKAWPAAFFSLKSRVLAYFHIRYLLYDRLPTEAEKQAAEAWLREGNEMLEQLTKKIGKIAQS